MLDEPLILSIEEMAQVTDGRWSAIPEKLLRIRVSTQDLKHGDFLVTTNTDQWGNKRHTENKQTLGKAIGRGLSAAMVRNGYEGSTCPLLRVADTRVALWDLARASRNKSNAVWILVTGTEGKTGFKIHLHHLLQPYLRVHARLDSNNMDTAVCTNIANVRSHHQVALVEVAVPSLDKGLQRANLVRPDICVITEIGYEHLRKHGSINKLISAKAAVVEAMKPGGVCIVKSDPRYFGKLREEIEKRQKVSLLTFGVQESDSAQLLKKEFDDENFGWWIEARIDTSMLRYFVPVVEEHGCLASIAVLLTASRLGIDPKSLSERFRTTTPFQTQGRLEQIRTEGGYYTLYDQSYRLYLLGLDAFFNAVARMHAKSGGKRILVLGNAYDRREYGRAVYDIIPYERFTKWLRIAKPDYLFTVGPKQVFSKYVPIDVPWIAHTENVSDMIPQLLPYIHANDMVFVKGDRDEKMFRITDALRELSRDIDA